MGCSQLQGISMRKKQGATRPYGFHQQRMLHLLTSTGIVLIATCGFALAQSASPGTAIVLDPIIIATGDNAALKKRFDAMPGGVTLVERDDRLLTANETVSRALSSVPGVVVQNFFGGNDQPRIQIRGSGLQQNPV